jgi:4-amino-4-deoxy-L-arabinose transferase-like glycosyltransferase
MNQEDKKTSGLYLLLFLVLGVLLRLLSFSDSLIDHDESTYAVIANNLLQGKHFFADVWDTKPIGIFLVFAGIIKIAGQSVEALRLAAALAIGLTAWFLYRTGRKLGKSNSLSMFSGLAYILMCSVHQWNFAANTEIFFNLTTVAGLWILLSKPENKGYLLGGLVLGMGFLIKHFVLADVLAIWIALLFILPAGEKGKWSTRIIPLTLWMGLGFSLPFLLNATWFFYQGLWQDFFFANFVLPRNYVSEARPGKALQYFSEFHLIYFPLVLMLLAAIFRGKDRPLAHFAALWYGLVWLMILLPGKYFHHYYFQLLPVLSLGVLAFPGSAPQIEAFLQKYRRMFFPASMALFIAWNTLLQYRQFTLRPDYPREMASFLKDRMEETDRLYCNGAMVIHFLLDEPVLHKYIHPTLLSKKEHREAAGIDRDLVFQSVVGQKPDWLVIEGNPSRLIREYIDNECVLRQRFGAQYRVYERKERKEL